MPNTATFAMSGFGRRGLRRSSSRHGRRGSSRFSRSPRELSRRLRGSSRYLKRGTGVNRLLQKPDRITDRTAGLQVGGEKRKKGLVSSAAKAMVVEVEKGKEARFTTEAMNAMRSGAILKTAIWHVVGDKLREKIGDREYGKTIEALQQLHIKDPYALTNPVDEMRAQKAASYGTLTGYGAAAGGVTLALSKFLQGWYVSWGAKSDVKEELRATKDLPDNDDRRARALKAAATLGLSEQDITAAQAETGGAAAGASDGEAKTPDVEKPKSADGTPPVNPAPPAGTSYWDSFTGAASSFWNTITGYIGAGATKVSGAVGGEKGVRGFMEERPWVVPAILGVLALAGSIYYKKRAFEKDLNRPSTEILKRDVQYWVNLRKRDDTCTQNLQTFGIALNQGKVFEGATAPFERLGAVDLQKMREADASNKLTDTVVDDNVKLFNGLLKDEVIIVHGYKVQIVQSKVASSGGRRLSARMAVRLQSSLGAYVRSRSRVRRHGRLF